MRYLYAFVMLTMILAVVWGTYLIAGTKTKTQIVHRPPVAATPISTRRWLLGVGVETAWIGHLGKVGDADCFSTVILDGKHIFSYCKLRRPGVVP